ncbi:MAG TPA: 2-octaprenyl-6-methoxyphenyl hydroxylase [Pseudomonadales bacterium]|nr:2-octaprenyl-6-methoxyphenyl hydroxylase [Pseudomonadales bacterium]HND15011.1 2-octaprenyl-6-methoxyphenyl hydroxylase [Pseudomonadales bacterium]
MSRKDCDVLIVGGGMVGASLACAMARSVHPWRVTLIESIAMPPAGSRAQQPSFDSRCTALSVGSAGFLERIGLWQGLQALVEPIRSIHVSDRGHFGSVLMDAAQEGLDALGYVAENRHLGQVLLGALRQAADVRIIAPARALAVRATAGGMEVEIEHGADRTRFAATLVVIADGARSALAGALGIASEQRDYGQTALIANIAHRHPHRGRAFERFTADGPLAMLPLGVATDGLARSALVWVQPHQQAAATGAFDDATFLARLQQRFGYRLGRLLRVGERQSYPLSLVRATEQARSGVVLLGNAAHALHPVAGQGFNLSLRDVAALAAVLDEARTRGESPGEAVVLQRFVARQAADQQRTIGFSDLLPRLFGSDALPLAAVRDLGLIGFELFPTLRSLLVRHATGLGSGGSAPT